MVWFNPLSTTISPEHKSVLLLCALVVILDHNQCQLLFLEVQLCNFRPKEKTNLGFSFEYQDTGRRETQAEDEE